MELTASLPKPKPRITKTNETSKSSQEIYEDDNIVKKEEPLDEEETSYLDKKKFWESVSKDTVKIDIKKRMSLCEDINYEKVLPRKRTSLHDIHESSVPVPIPKPRSITQVTSSTQEIDTAEEEIAEIFDKPMSEYRASFIDHSQNNVVKAEKKEDAFEKIDKQKQIMMDIHKEARILEKSDSSESDISQEKSSTQQENTGYISDSGDVEHYISDSEIEDRVPQIRERLMSIAHPVTAPRKTIYERSMSLPTEDLYQVSAQSILLRKKYYEEQIKKDMVEDELMTKLEEESSPEHKTLETLHSIDIEEEDELPGMKSAPEISDDNIQQASVRDIAKTFETTAFVKSDDKTINKPTTATNEDIETKDDVVITRKCVKDIAKSFEGEPIIVAKPTKIKRDDSLNKIQDIKDFQEIVKTQTDEIIERYEKSIKETKEVIEHQSFEELQTTMPAAAEVHLTMQIDKESGFHVVKDAATYKTDKRQETEESETDLFSNVKGQRKYNKSQIKDMLPMESSKIDELPTTEQEKDEFLIRTLEEMATSRDGYKTEIRQGKLQEVSESQQSKETKVDMTELKSVLPEQDLECETNIPKPAVRRGDKKSTFDITEDVQKDDDELKELPIDRADVITETSKTESILSHKIEYQSDVSQTPQIQTHKETEIITQVKQYSIDSDIQLSDTSIPSSQMNDYNKYDTDQKPSDSLEVHVDKSEIEDSEKMTDFDATDIETKSLDSLNAIDSSPKSFDMITDEKLKISKFTPELESPIKQPEEHIPDIIWETPVQSEIIEEHVELIPYTEVKQVFVETDDLSSSVREESDLGSEIHQDHSASMESDKIKSESQTDIEKMILESLHNQKISPDEAKLIASELVADIEAEIRRRHSSSASDILEPPMIDYSKTQISEYLQQLADAKGLDSREVQLVQSVLARKQRELTKLSRDDTQASSMEITDEDLRYSGGEVDYSPSGSRAHILEEQIDQLEAEHVLDPKSELEALITEDAKKETTTEKLYTESSTIRTEEINENAKNGSGKYKASTTTRQKESSLTEKHLSEKTNVILEEEDTVLESLSEESERTEKKQTEETLTVEELEKDESSIKATSSSSSIEEMQKQVDIAMKITDVISDTKEKTEIKTEGSELLSDKKIAKDESHTQEIKKIEAGVEITTSKKLSETEEQFTTTTHVIAEGSAEIQKPDDKGDVKQIVRAHMTVENTSTSVDHTHEESHIYKERIIHDLSDKDVKKLIDDGLLEMDKDQLLKANEEVTQIIHEEISRKTSSESKSSQDENFKSPEDQISSSSSERKDTDGKTEEEKVVRRKCFARDVESSSSSSLKKGDRKSGLEFEAYSSSGESHYQSFELDSAKSRPCSSDVENLFAAGSSEYESALTSQDISSAPSHMTSNEYITAASTLSSKESMKSLDSESSGNLASVEVSEASETLVPSAFELEGDDILEQQEDIILEHPRLTTRQSTELSDSELNFIGPEEGLASEDDSMNGTSSPVDVPSKMKRSCEMTFQPEPKVLVPESPLADITHDSEEKFGSSLDEGSVLSVSLSSTSSAAQVRTVIELSHAETLMNVSGTSEQLSIEDVENVPHSFGDILYMPPQSSEISTSTHPQPSDVHIDSVTITTSVVDENGIQSVSTQVTSEAQQPDVFDPPTHNGFVELEPKKRGHRRTESSSFTPSMIQSLAQTTNVERKLHYDLAEKDPYTDELSYKEVRSDEKKDVDESYETEADQAYQKARYLDTDIDNDIEVFDTSRPHSQISISDSDRERIPSTGYSDDRPDSELAELAKQCSSEAITDPIERPISPEPLEECEIKDDTPEFSSEAQASVGELEQEYSSAIARSQELITEIKKTPSKIIPSKENVDSHEVHTKLSGSSSEKSSFEEAEAEAAFSMVAHISPAHKVKQICPILEDEDAEKHELETRERVLKDLEIRRKQKRDVSPGSIPDIKVTQHMAPLVDKGFHYPDLELEEKEEAQTSTPQTPASNSSKSSEDTDQGREYILDHVDPIPEEPDNKGIDEKESMTESKSEAGTVVEKTVYETDKETDSPNSDSFEMLEKPDLIDDFVVIEEVAKEAQESDMEGKSVSIAKIKHVKKHDEEVEDYLVRSAPPQPKTKMTGMKYYPEGGPAEELGFDFEESPPQPNQKPSDTSSSSSVEPSPRDYVYEYDRELEANKKWIEQQFQGNHAAMMAAGYGYEMEFERGPLEDIKEEDITDFDPTSSRIGSLGSQKESGGSGSIKDSFSSTPEYDVLAGRRYFTKSGEHDDISMSSLQEFENLERVISLENRQRLQQSSVESSNGSFKRYYCGRSGQGDDVSVSSLKEFEGLEKACIAAHTIEVKANEEEALLAQIEEGQESLASEAGSCETVSGTEKKLITDSDEEDYEKRMFEIDEIIKQAQSNVEKFIDLRAIEKTESIGRGDSFEEVSRVPDLELDAPLSKIPSTKVQWVETDDVMMASTDSLELKQEKPSHHDSTDSLDLKSNAPDIMTTSTDSIDGQVAKSTGNVMSDSIENKEEFDRSCMITSDSLELATGKTANLSVFSDSIDEDGSRICGHDQSTSSTGKDISSSQREEEIKEPPLFEGADSFDRSSSTATHATAHYETDTIYSGSFTSAGSNTMVSSTDTIDPTGMHEQEAVDLAAACRKVWFDDDSDEARHRFTTEYVDDTSKPYVTEVIEPCDEEGFTHTIHRRVELPPEIRKITFTGQDVDYQVKQYIENFGEGEDITETEEIDADGNVHKKRVVQKRIIIKSDTKPSSQQSSSDNNESQALVKRTYTDGQGTKTIYTQQFNLQQMKEEDGTTSAIQNLLTSIAGDTTGLLL